MPNVEETRVRETIQIYFDSMFESKADKVHQAFHPNARISGDTPQGFIEMTVADFASFIHPRCCPFFNAMIRYCVGFPVDGHSLKT